MVRSQFPERLTNVGSAAAVHVGTIDDANVALAVGHRSIALDVLLYVGASQALIILGHCLTCVVFVSTTRTEKDCSRRQGAFQVYFRFHILTYIR